MATDGDGPYDFRTSCTMAEVLNRISDEPGKEELDSVDKDMSKLRFMRQTSTGSGSTTSYDSSWNHDDQEDNYRRTRELDEVEVERSYDPDCSKPLKKRLQARQTIHWIPKASTLVSADCSLSRSYGKRSESHADVISPVKQDLPKRMEKLGVIDEGILCRESTNGWFSFKERTRSPSPVYYPSFKTKVPAADRSNDESREVRDDVELVDSENIPVCISQHESIPATVYDLLVEPRYHDRCESTLFPSTSQRLSYPSDSSGDSYQHRGHFELAGSPKRRWTQGRPTDGYRTTDSFKTRQYSSSSIQHAPERKPGSRGPLPMSAYRPFELMSEGEKREERKREGNRKAQARMRQKKKEEVSHLRIQIDELILENQRLTMENNELKEYLRKTLKLSAPEIDQLCLERSQGLGLERNQEQTHVGSN